MRRNTGKLDKHNFVKWTKFFAKQNEFVSFSLVPQIYYIAIMSGASIRRHATGLDHDYLRQNSRLFTCDVIVIQGHVYKRLTFKLSQLFARVLMIE
jgi:hypothetical protein